MTVALLGAIVGLRLLAVPLGWGVLAAAATVGVMILLWRAILTRRAGAQPRCAACGHQIARLGASRCAECGADLSHGDASRWDRRPSLRTRLFIGATIAMSLVLSTVIGGLAVGVAEWHSSERSDSSPPAISALVRSLVRGDRPDDALAPLVTLLRGGNPATIETIRATLLAELGPTGIDAPCHDQTRAVHTIVSTFLNLVADGDAWESDAQHVHAELVRRAIGTPRPLLRTRHHVGSAPMVVRPPDGEQWWIALEHRLTRVLVDGEALPLPEAEGRASSWPVRPWFSLPSRAAEGVYEVTIEWDVSIIAARPHEIEGFRRSAVTIPRIDTRRIEVVAADEPTIRPTQAPERSPWGDRETPRYHVEFAPLGMRQVAGVVLVIPGRTGVRVDGSVLLEQDGRSVRFALPVTAIDPAFPSQSWHDGALVDPPFDLHRPIALRFEPTERSAAHDPDPADPHDFWWAEPFEIELRPDSPIRRTRPGGRVIWFGGAERDPPR